MAGITVSKYAPGLRLQTGIHGILIAFKDLNMMLKIMKS